MALGEENIKVCQYNYHTGALCGIFGSEVVDDPDLSGFVLDWKSVAVEMRTTLLVSIGRRVTSMGVTTISGCECRRSRVRRLKGALEQLKTFSFRD